MTEKQVLIWNKLKSFDLNDGSPLFSFTDRLAKENNWSVQKTFRAIEAYRRFLLLAVSTGHPVSPSAIVDEVWHLHLLYTRNYWQKLCRDTLETELHHEPTRGGSQETAKFTDWYAKTLESYRTTFNEAPPEEFWPPAGTKIAKPDLRKIDMTHHYVLPKSRFAQLVLIAIVAITLLAFAGGWSAPTSPSAITLAALDNPLDYKGRDFISFYVFVVLLAFAVAIGLRWQARRGSIDTRVDRQLDPYAVAYLSESASLAVRAAIANLIGTKRLTLHPDSTVERVSSTHSSGLPPLEEAILMTTTIPASPATIERRVRPQLDQIEAGLTESRLLVSRPDRTMAGLGHLLIGGTFIVGVVKCILAVGRERPVGFLMAMLALTLIGWIVISSRSLHRTRAGDAALARLRNKHQRDDHVPAAASPINQQHTSDAGGAPAHAFGGGMMGFHPMTMMFALYGPSILMGHPELGHTYNALGAQAPIGGGTGDSGGSDGGGDSSDSSSDSGDAGSSCSSGCGGCSGGD